MIGHRALASSFALTALLVTACSESTLVEPSAMDLAPSRSAASGPYGVDATVVTLAPGATHQLTASKSANGMDVPTASIAWSSSNPSVATVSATGLVTAVATGEAIVSANRGSHSEQVTVVVGTCSLGVLPVGTTNGEITALDCYFAAGDRYSDYFSVSSTNGEVMRFATTGIPRIVGVKETTSELAAGTVYGSTRSAPFRVISNGEPLQLYLSGETSTDLGAYSITRSIDTETHTCGTNTFVVPGASFAANMQASNACRYNVAFTNYPPALGMPLYAHRYWIKVEELKPYTVTVSGVSSSFDPAVVIFPNILKGAPIASALPGIDAPPATRSVTFTPPELGYYMIEVSTGRFIVSESGEEWVNHTGPFGVSVSR